MTIQLITTGLMALLLGSVQSHGQNKPAINYLGISGPLTLKKKSYQLIWSSHPDPSLLQTGVRYSRRWISELQIHDYY